MEFCQIIVTVLKLHNFSVTQILREIKVRVSRVFKSGNKSPPQKRAVLKYYLAQKFRQTELEPRPLIPFLRYVVTSLL